MPKILILSLFLSGMALDSYAQRKEVSVEKLGSHINSEAEEVFPLLDLKTNILYFSRALHPDNKGGKYAGTDIWYIDLNSQDASATKNGLDNLNNKSNNYVVGINEKDSILYLNQPKTAEKGFQFSKKRNGRWIRPEGINIPDIPVEGYRGIYVSPDFHIAILSIVNDQDNQQEDLYYSIREERGKWTAPKSLGPSINTPGREISPYLSEDKRKLYFSSDGLPGEGGMDIFVAERLYDNWEVWSRPKNMGNKINSNGFDAYFTIYHDTLAYFCSNRNSELSDIYRADINYTDMSQLASSTITIKSDNYAIYDDNAIQELFGVPLNQTLRFQPNSEELEDSSKEFLYFIIENMKTNPQIGIMILADKNNSKLTPTRFIKASMLFLKNGITSKRVTLIEEEIENFQENEFLFYFYRLEE